VQAQRIDRQRFLGDCHALKPNANKRRPRALARFHSSFTVRFYSRQMSD
jgi:hypothetical protein